MYTNLSAGSSGDPCSETYRGPSAGSEVELQNLDSFVQDIIEEHGPIFELGITIHSYGQFMVYGYGYTTDIDPPNREELVNILFPEICNISFYNQFVLKLVTARKSTSRHSSPIHMFYICFLMLCSSIHIGDK